MNVSSFNTILLLVVSVLYVADILYLGRSVRKGKGTRNEGYESVSRSISRGNQLCNSNLELVKNQRCRIRFHYGVIDYDHSIKINRSKTRAKTIHILSTQSCRSAQPQQRDTQDMFHKIRVAHLDIRTATSPLGNIRVQYCD